MLTITVPEEELYNEVTSEFVTTEAVVVEMEHSLVSLSKWESKWEKPFLSGKPMTAEELLSYVEYMILTPKIPPGFSRRLSQTNLVEINAYIESKQTATTFGSLPEHKGKGETITSELVYYWLIAFSIPFDCQYWHLNRLFSLIRICNIKNSKPKKMSRNEMAQRNREINAKRKAELNTSG